MQAEVTCTVQEGRRVANCRIDRVAPEGTLFGRRVLSSMRQGRLREGPMQVGDTLSFVIWACTDVDRPCQPMPWPGEQAAALDRPAAAP